MAGTRNSMLQDVQDNMHTGAAGSAGAAASGARATRRGSPQPQLGRALAASPPPPPAREPEPAPSPPPPPHPAPAPSTGKDAGPVQRLVSAMQLWMMRVIQQHGFVGILLLASWPNAAFDLCGICCGAFKMPFWEFFGATLIGKGAVKVSGQALFFVALFRQVRPRRALVQPMLGQAGPGWVRRGWWRPGPAAYSSRPPCCCSDAASSPAAPPTHALPTPLPSPPPRQATRDKLLAALGALLPAHLPGAPPGAPPPAATLKGFVDGQVGERRQRRLRAAPPRASCTGGTPGGARLAPPHPTPTPPPPTPPPPHPPPTPTPPPPHPHQIAKFQVRVVASAAAHHGETRWWWTRAAHYLRTHFGSGPAAARAWAAAQVPDTVSEVWGWVILVLIGMFAVSCINALAQGQKAWAEEEAARRRGGGGDAQRQRAKGE
jgi:hypothetical protein